MIRRGAGLFGTLAVALVLSAWGCGDDETKSSSTGNGGQGATADGGGGTTTTTTTTTTTSTGGMGGSGGMVVALDGDCIMPGVLGLGDTINGNTSNGADNLSGPCQQGSDNESVYSFAASETGTLTVSITSDADLGIYVHTVCDDTNSVIACADAEFGAAATETLTFGVTSGETYFIIVDGYEAGEAGAFTLTVGNAIEVEICDNSTDDNGNLLVDCEDPGCAANATCTGGIAAACGAAIALTPNVAQSGDTANGTNLFAGTCSGFGSSEVVYSYTPALDQVMSATLASASDQGMYVRDTCADSDTQLACIDAAAGGSDELLRHVLLTGATPISLFVDGYMAGEEGPYTLTALTANITETEPNDTTATADVFLLGHLGYIPTGDNDFISVTLAVTGNLTVTTTDVFAGDCANSLIDTEVELLDTDGTTQLQFNDDIDEANGDYCSSVSAATLPAGTYLVRVGASQQFCANCTMGYTLSVTIN